MTKKDSEINLKFFEQYYEGRQKAVAYKLSNIVRYNNPRDIATYGVKVAPQSFVYV